jgi:hypothetical protein
LLTTCISPFTSFETSFVTCWMTLILSNPTLRSEILCQIFSSWWDFGEVCASCAKSAGLCCLVLKLLKFSLYLVLNEKFRYADFEALGCLPYPVVRPSAWSRDHLRKIMSNTVISKLQSVCRTQSCDSLRGLEIIWELKMSKLLNLLLIHLHVYSLVQIELIVAYVSVWQSTHLKLLLLTLRWSLSCLYILSCLRLKSLCLWWLCWNCYIA